MQAGGPQSAEAVRFGIGIERDGYNIFALGPAGSGKHFIVEHFLTERASTRPVPPDLCYVNNFAEPNKPTLLTVPPGLGISLKKDLKEFVEEVMTALPAIFESEEYQARANAIRQRRKYVAQRRRAEHCPCCFAASSRHRSPRDRTSGGGWRNQTWKCAPNKPPRSFSITLALARHRSYRRSHNG